MTNAKGKIHFARSFCQFKNAKEKIENNHCWSSMNRNIGILFVRGTQKKDKSGGWPLVHSLGATCGLRV